MINYKYCPQCKSDLDLEDQYPYCKRCKLTIYLNSKPTASVLIMKGDKLLLAKRSTNPYKGKYGVVGGFLENGEDPKSGALREVKEETGLTARIEKFLGIYVDKYEKGEFTFNLCYVGRIAGGKMKAQDDVASLEWFDLDSLPKPPFKSQIEVFKDLKKWYFGRGGQN